MTEYVGIYEAIIESTTSELIHFFIIVAIVVAVVVTPLYIAMLRDRKAARVYEQERDERLQANERENRQQIIDVVKENSAVIAGLKVMLGNSGDTSKSALERIHARIDGTQTAINGVAADVAQVKTKMENSLGNQTEMASKINKILLIVSDSNFPARGGKE